MFTSLGCRESADCLGKKLFPRGAMRLQPLLTGEQRVKEARSGQVCAYRTRSSMCCAREYYLAWLLAVLVAISGAHGQLAYLQQNSAVNPLQGQGTPPEGFEDSQVSVYIVLNRLLGVNEDSYSFKVNFWWGMMWQDDRTYEIIQSNTLSDPTYICQAWCSTAQDLNGSPAADNGTSTSVNQGLCCDNVYVPGAVAQNVVGYDVQSLPVQYQLETLPNNTVSYRVQVQGDFYTNFNFESYPFDRHQMTINFQTQFNPRALKNAEGSGADFLVLYAHNFGDSLDDTGQKTPLSVDVYNSAQLSQGQAWQIDELEMDAMNFTYTTSGSGANPSFGQAESYGQNNEGVRFVISISRTSKGFYALMIIVPISLIILFCFVIYILPVTQIKGRMNIMATLFLTLVVLQFVLEGIMPASYTLMPPYYLLLVSYIYIFGMVGLAIFTNSLATQWERRSMKIERTEASHSYRQWRETLPKAADFDDVSMHQQHRAASNPITEPKPLAMLLHFDSAKESTACLPSIKESMTSEIVGDDGNAYSAEDLSMRSGTAYHPRPWQAEGDEFDEADEFEGCEKAALAKKRQMHLMRKMKSQPWLMKHRSHFMKFLLKNEIIRWWSMWWYFIGRPESKEYCEYCANRVEQWVLPVLFVSYAAVVAIIFGVAQSSSSTNLDSPVG